MNAARNDQQYVALVTSQLAHVTGGYIIGATRPWPLLGGPIWLPRPAPRPTNFGACGRPMGWPMGGPFVPNPWIMARR